MISIVVGGRNDGYGQDFLGRFQNFVRVLLPLLQTRAGDFELIVVEWNPQNDRPRLAQAVAWPEAANTVPTRIIEVGPEVHADLPGSDRMGFFEFLAKNVGVRRAWGEYVLVTNPDVFFTPELVGLLGEAPFQPDWFYRMDRYDTRVPPGLPEDPRQALAIAQENIFCCHRMDRSLPIDDAVRARALAMGLWPGTHPPAKPPLIPLDAVSRPNWGLHTNGSGDFLLTHRRNWDRIHGFPEYADTCTHLDSYACYQLKAAGVRQALITLPCRLLHQDHSRQETARRPKHSSQHWQDDLAAIRDGRLGPAISGADWGLGSLSLPETQVGTARPPVGPEPTTAG